MALSRDLKGIDRKPYGAPRQQLVIPRGRALLIEGTADTKAQDGAGLVCVQNSKEQLGQEGSREGQASEMSPVMQVSGSYLTGVRCKTITGFPWIAVLKDPKRF